MTNINDPGRPNEPTYGGDGSDEAVFRDAAAKRSPLPEEPDELIEAGAGSDHSGSGSAAETAKANAKEMAGQAADQAADVAATAKDKAAEVTGTAKSEARSLLSQAQEELQAQAGQQQQRAASGLSATAADFRSMADGSEKDGTAANLVRQAGERVGQIGQWLAEREPGDVLAEVQAFARRRPGVFIAAAVIAGVAAGRLARSLKDGEE